MILLTFSFISDVVIPTNGGERGNIVLKAGQKVLVLKSPKGIYMQLECGKIVAIRTAMKMRGANAANPIGIPTGKISPGGAPKSSDEASSDGSLLKKVNPRANLAASKALALPLKNNSSVTITPKMQPSQQKTVQPLKQNTPRMPGKMGSRGGGNSRGGGTQRMTKGTPRSAQFGKSKGFQRNDTQIIPSSDDDHPEEMEALSEDELAIIYEQEKTLGIYDKVEETFPDNVDQTSSSSIMDTIHDVSVGGPSTKSTISDINELSSSEGRSDSETSIIEMNKPFKRDVRTPGFQILEVKSLDKSEMINVDAFQESQLSNELVITPGGKNATILDVSKLNTKPNLKNYRHNFKGIKPTSALSRLEQTTSSIGVSILDSKASLQSSLDKITADSPNPEAEIIPIKKTQSVLPLKDGLVIEQKVIKPKAPRKNARKMLQPPPIQEPQTIDLDSSDNESPTKMEEINKLPEPPVQQPQQVITPQPQQQPPPQQMMPQQQPPPMHPPPMHNYPPQHDPNMYNYNYNNPYYGYNQHPYPAPMMPQPYPPNPEDKTVVKTETAEQDPSTPGYSRVNFN